MYAIIENGGKQYKVSKGDTFQVEKIAAEEGSIISDSKVLLISDGRSFKVGKPYVEGVEVSLKVLGHGKGDKILVYKFKAKKNYRRKQGHRQPFTEVQVESISVKSKETKEKEAKK